jgi:hypothetical protein
LPPSPSWSSFSSSSSGSMKGSSSATSLDSNREDEEQKDRLQTDESEGKKLIDRLFAPLQPPAPSPSEAHRPEDGHPNWALAPDDPIEPQAGPSRTPTWRQARRPSQTGPSGIHRSDDPNWEVAPDSQASGSTKKSPRYRERVPKDEAESAEKIKGFKMRHNSRLARTAMETRRANQGARAQDGGTGGGSSGRKAQGKGKGNQRRP